MQNKLQKIKIFVKINFRKTYNLIRIKKNTNEWQFSKLDMNFTNIQSCRSNLRTLQQHVKYWSTMHSKKYLNIFIIAYFDDILIYSKNAKKTYTACVRNVSMSKYMKSINKIWKMYFSCFWNEFLKISDRKKWYQNEFK